jgi:hypothetical protein
MAVNLVEPSACLRARIVAMIFLEVPSHSWHLYGTSATQKRPLMHRNTTEMPRSEKPTEIGVSDKRSAKNIDRKISVAPMMDWID